MLLEVRENRKEWFTLRPKMEIVVLPLPFRDTTSVYRSMGIYLNGEPPVFKVEEVKPYSTGTNWRIKENPCPDWLEGMLFDGVAPENITDAQYRIRFPSGTGWAITQFALVPLHVYELLSAQGKQCITDRRGELVKETLAELINLLWREVE